MRKFTFLLRVSDYCPLNCEYCYAVNDKAKSMSMETIGSLVSFINKSNDITDVKIIWHGAEPLSVGYKKLEEMLSFINANCTKNVSHGIQTNAVLINSKFIRLFKEYEFSVGISVDGYGDVHDIHRPYKDGRGSFSTVVRNIESLLSEKIPTSCICVISKRSIPYLKEIYDFFSERALPVRFSPVRPYGKSQGITTVLSKEESAKTLCKLYDWWSFSSNKIEPIDFIEMINNLVGNQPKLCVFSENCQQGILSISSEGRVFPCTDFFEDSDSYGFISELHSLSSVRDTPLYDSFEKRNLLVDECNSCVFKNACNKGCPYRSQEYGDFMKKNPYECYVNYELYSHIFNHIVTTIEEATNER